MHMKKNKLVLIIAIFFLVITVVSFENFLDFEKLSSSITSYIDIAYRQNFKNYNASNEKELNHILEIIADGDTINVVSDIVYTGNFRLENMNLKVAKGATLTVTNPIDISGECVIGGGGKLNRATGDFNLLVVNGTLITEDILLDGGAIWCNTCDNLEQHKIHFSATSYVTDERASVVTANIGRNVHNVGIISTASLILVKANSIWNTVSDKPTMIQNFYSNNISCIMSELNINMIFNNSVIRNNQVISAESGLFGTTWDDSAKGKVTLNGTEIYGNLNEYGSYIIGRSYGPAFELNNVNIHNNASGNISTDNYKVYGLFAQRLGKLTFNSGIVKDNETAVFAGTYNDYAYVYGGFYLNNRLGFVGFNQWGSTGIYIYDGVFDNQITDTEGYLNSSLYLYGGTFNNSIHTGSGLVSISNKNDKLHINGTLSYSSNWNVSRLYLSQPLTEDIYINFHNGTIVSGNDNPKSDNYGYTIIGNNYAISKNDLNHLKWASNDPGTEDYKPFLSIKKNRIVFAKENPFSDEKSVQIYALGYTGTFDNKPHTFTVTTEEGVNIKYYKNSERTIEYSDGKPSFTKAGEYIVYYIASKEGYEQTPGSVKVTINKYALNMENNRELIYTGDILTRYAGNDYCNITGINSAIDAGDYNIKLTWKDEFKDSCVWKIDGVEQTGDSINLSWSIKDINRNKVEFVIKDEMPEIDVSDKNFKNPIQVISEDLPITYSSSKPEIVDVDATTGELDIKKTGKVKISASSPGGIVDGVEYSSNSASFWLRVVSNDGGEHILVEEPRVEPTCTTHGYEATKRCKICGQIFDEHEIPALGHNIVVDKGFAPTCTKKGLTAGEHCTRCNYAIKQKEISLLAHTIVIDHEIEPTDTTTGLTEGSHCDVCGKVIVAQKVIPAKADDMKPSDNDDDGNANIDKDIVNSGDKEEISSNHKDKNLRGVFIFIIIVIVILFCIIIMKKMNKKNDEENKIGSK